MTSAPSAEPPLRIAGAEPSRPRPTAMSAVVSPTVFQNSPGPLPLYLKDRRTTYWFETLPNEPKTRYFQFNLVVNSQTTYDIPGATATLKDAKGGVLTKGTTDEDGWYMLPYKWTGKATTLYVTLTANGYKSQTKQITLKANGYGQVDFTEP